jgi:hypothetical protein
MNVATRSLFVLITIALFAVPTGAQFRGQSFFFVEESGRLPLDTTLPGTSTTDVDLVDVDGDGDLDLFIAEGTDSPGSPPEPAPAQ